MDRFFFLQKDYGTPFSHSADERTKHHGKYFLALFLNSSLKILKKIKLCSIVVDVAR